MMFLTLTLQVNRREIVQYDICKTLFENRPARSFTVELYWQRQKFFGIHASMQVRDVGIDVKRLRPLPFGLILPSRLSITSRSVS